MIAKFFISSKLILCYSWHLLVSWSFWFIFIYVPILSIFPSITMEGHSCSCNYSSFYTHSNWWLMLLLLQFSTHDVVVLKPNKADLGSPSLGQGVVYRLKVSFTSNIGLLFFVIGLIWVIPIFTAGTGNLEVISTGLINYCCFWWHPRRGFSQSSEAGESSKWGLTKQSF